jgi:hypothetical protein
MPPNAQRGDLMPSQVAERVIHEMWNAGLSPTWPKSAVETGGSGQTRREIKHVSVPARTRSGARGNKHSRVGATEGSEQTRREIKHVSVPARMRSGARGNKRSRVDATGGSGQTRREIEHVSVPARTRSGVRGNKRCRLGTNSTSHGHDFSLIRGRQRCTRCDGRRDNVLRVLCPVPYYLVPELC